ncbi:MAG: CPBP family intramembrane metalloprotease [Actinobacteria bacterium]|nr:CPBP family intramembrane metalloprotease [Actinomycetota bacterium]
MDNPPLPGPVGPRCSQHPASPAVAQCVACGRYLCAGCRVLVGNRSYCAWCAATPAAYGYPPPAAPAVPYRRPGEIVFPDAPWGIGEALIIFLAALVMTSIVSVALFAFLNSITSTTTALFMLVFLSSVIMYSLLLGGTYYSVTVRHGGNHTALGLKLDGMGRGIAIGVGLGLPLFIGALLLAYLSQFILEPTNTDYLSKSVTEMSRGGINPVLILLFFFTLVILAPVCEEIFFRGYLYPALRNRMNQQPAMLLNGLLFAAAHFDLVGFLPRFLLGYGLCWIYDRNRTLGGPIAGHALYNGLILLLCGIWQLF